MASSSTDTPGPAGKYYGLLLLMIVIWAASFLVVDVAVEVTTPLSIAMFRLLVASISFLVTGLVLQRRKRARANDLGNIGSAGEEELGGHSNLERPTHFSRKEILLVILASIFGVGLFFPIQYVAISLVGPSIPALMVCLFSPIVLTIFALFFFKEKLTIVKFGGILLGAVGALMILTEGEVPSFSWEDQKAVGNLLAFFTPFMWAGYSLCTKELSKTRDSFQVTAYANYGGTIIIFFVVAVTGDWHSWSEGLISGRFIGAVLYLALGCSLVGYLIWMVAIKNLDAARASVFLYAEPFITVFLAFLFLHEPFNSWALGGGVIVLAGVLIVTLPGLWKTQKARIKNRKK